MQSAALGLAIAGALALGYSNIFVTAPSPENLRTLFEFIFKGLDQLDYKEHLDYDLVESNNPAFAKAIVRVNVFKNHRQVRPVFDTAYVSLCVSGWDSEATSRTWTMTWLRAPTQLLLRPLSE